MAFPKGFEPPTFRFGSERAIQLRHENKLESYQDGALGRTRTSNPQIRSLVLYPLSYQRVGRAPIRRASDVPCSRIGLKLVPRDGIEPPTLRFSVACSTN